MCIATNLCIFEDVQNGNGDYVHYNCFSKYIIGQQPGTGFGTQVPGYGPGIRQQIPTYIPGGGFTQPGSDQPIQSSGKPQVPQYGVGGEQVPTYGRDDRPQTGVAGQPGQQIPSYGQPGQRGGVSQAPGQQVMQPGTFYRPGKLFLIENKIKFKNI